MSSDERPGRGFGTFAAPVSRAELGLLGLLLVAGFLFRVWDLGAIDLDHFDEGVYAISALGLTDPEHRFELFPGQVLFSPPAYFGLVGMAYALAGQPSAVAALMVNVLLGTLSIAAIWKVAREWFDPAAGITAAVLLALSEFHISFSRTVLTDVGFSLFFLLALWAIVRALRRASVGWTLAAAGLVGLAWNTKYHGWFALVISGAALVAYGLVMRAEIETVWPRWRRWVAVSALSTACYLPWALFVQSQPGGYAVLAAHQKTMLSRDWLANLWRQVEQQHYLEGPLSRIAIPVALVILVAVTKPGSRRSVRSPLLLGGLATILSLTVGLAGTSALAALLAIPLLLGGSAYYPAWLLLGWMGVFATATPLYHPYARLTLPLTVAIFLATGYGLSSLVGRPRELVSAAGPRRVIVATAAAALLLVVALLVPDASSPWRSGSRMSAIARAIDDAVPRGDRLVVIGEPTLNYYLILMGRDVRERVDAFEVLDGERAPVFVVTGVYTKRAPSLREGFARRSDRLEKLRGYHIVPRDVRLLDDMKPSAARAYLERPDETFDLSLYRLAPTRVGGAGSDEAEPSSEAAER